MRHLLVGIVSLAAFACSSTTAPSDGGGGDATVPEGGADSGGDAAADSGTPDSASEAGTCGPNNCAGCCRSATLCINPPNDTQCGKNGVACVPCLGKTCNLQTGMCQ